LVPRDSFSFLIPLEVFPPRGIAFPLGRLVRSRYVFLSFRLVSILPKIVFVLPLFEPYLKYHNWLPFFTVVRSPPPWVMVPTVLPRSVLTPFQLLATIRSDSLSVFFWSLHAEPKGLSFLVFEDGLFLRTLSLPPPPHDRSCCTDCFLLLLLADFHCCFVVRSCCGSLD